MKFTAALAAIVLLSLLGLWLWLPDAVQVRKQVASPVTDDAPADALPDAARPLPQPPPAEPPGETDPGGASAARTRGGGGVQPADPPASPPTGEGPTPRALPPASPPPTKTPAPGVSPSRPGMAPEAPPAIASDFPALELGMPVAGIDASALVDTFTDARSNGRSHEAIDIMAPVGTPVLAVADGTIAKLFDSQQGGLTVYQFDVSGALAFYYAHLDAYADGLVEGVPVRKGEVIGTVGYTGNAHPDAPHLHFAIFVLGPERHWWQGTAINPFPYLRGP